MNILALDLGKFNSMCCFFDTDTQKYSFLGAATARRYMRTVLEKNPIDLIVMEACGPSGWISDLCAELGLKTLVCSTTEEAWRWKNVKRKTDKDDALKLAHLGERPISGSGECNSKQRSTQNNKKSSIGYLTNHGLHSRMGSA